MVVSAGGDLPEALKAQVAVGGRIVVPLPEGDWQVLTVLHRTGEETWEVERGEPVRFVPLIASVADDGGE
ncbi:Protein-L-isoaspartate(D-aspartate) O-methyltransferase (PCMT) [Tranquillimonas alkanivorans]|uniref:Protein-L-isoaspartate(D-aspartate) O-methyltransferase (PCMT) n=1 Tax=Tranquillimonas alkanivorans TaxID=441119 RepID=A0A1I5R9Z8_9RHOB|nr:Protein-L-isoaspartate(D-aspartate) O-methyltransferase (PCMT) [Tranquillimonas alkanivorans]